MVLGLLFINSIPTTIATVQSINSSKQEKKKQEDEEKSGIKFNVTTGKVANATKRDQIDSKVVVLRNERVCGHSILWKQLKLSLLMLVVSHFGL
jgi:hypothetical protein